jgi:hypothetical protein
MDRIHGEEEASKDELEVRARQFQALVQTLNDLKCTIAEDEVKKRALERRPRRRRMRRRKKKRMR